MKGSRERVRKALALEKPDRTPLFDLIANDAVLQYFNNGLPLKPGDDRGGVAAVSAATDGTRIFYFSPMVERRESLPDGRSQKYDRWSIWTSPRIFSSSVEYREVKKREIAELLANPASPAEDSGYLKHRELYSWFGEDYSFLLAPPHPGLMGIYSEVGIEAFSYYLVDCEDIIIEQLEANTEYACRWAKTLPPDDPFDGVFIGDDIAFKTGPILNPDWLNKNLFPRLKRVIDVLHARGKKVMFHSDGNINAVMDGLVEAGIDALNPVEIAAGMSLPDLHRRYPRLVFAGGIDVSALLPFGTPGEVKDAVRKAIEDTEGRILVGSSTEVFNSVPLKNFLAMREAALEP